MIPEIKIKSIEITDPIAITNSFNKHFVEMGDRLSTNIPQSNVAPESYLNDLQNSVNKLTCFRDITQTEMLNIYFTD